MATSRPPRRRPAPPLRAACVALASGVLLLGGLHLAACKDQGTGVSACGDGECDPATETVLSCPLDCVGLCGNGVAEAGEECDGDDLAGLGCQDLGCGFGTLQCDAECRVQTAGCGSPCGSTCGDGVREGQEQCDCGLDPYDLPALCGAPNGDLLSFCDASCNWTLRCGNQVVDAGEECDCGIDPDTLPEGCTRPNGYADGECGADCLLQPNYCSIEVLADQWCELSLPESQCCPDDWGNPATCLHGLDPDYGRCVLQCATTQDCHYNNYCFDGECWPALCGPQHDGSEFYDVCQVPGGEPGICVPVDVAEDEVGLCFENSPNAILAGYDCPAEYRELSFPRDVALDTCLNGGCFYYEGIAERECASFCDWHDVYDNDANQSWCPADTNCVAASFVAPDHPDPAIRGLRGADLAYCRHVRDAVYTSGITSCDLLNDQLVRDRTQTCPDAHPGSVCQPYLLPTVLGDERTWGTLIGSCTDVGSATPIAVWDPCDVTTDLCVAGSWCFPADAFAPQPAGPDRCVPLCDTADPAPCAAAHPTVPVTNVCTTVSAHFRPGATPGTSTDGSPSRVGLCALPPP